MTDHALILAGLIVGCIGLAVRSGCLLWRREFLLPEEAGEHCGEGLHQPIEEHASMPNGSRGTKNSCASFNVINPKLQVMDPYSSRPS